MPRFTVRVLNGDRLILSVNEGGTDKNYAIKPEQAHRLATMLNFRASQIEMLESGRQRT